MRLSSVKGKDAERILLAAIAKGHVLVAKKSLKLDEFKRIMSSLAEPLLKALKGGTIISLVCSTEIFNLCASSATKQKVLRKTRPAAKQKKRHKCPTLDEALGCYKCNPPRSFK